MKKLMRIILGIFLSVMAAFSLVAALFSSLWNQNSTLVSTDRWKKLDSGWSINAKYTDETLGTVAIWRTFYDSDRFWESDSSYMKTPSLFFVTHNQSVRMMMIVGDREEVIYSQGNEGTRFAGTQCGNVIHSVRLPDVNADRFMIVIQFIHSFQSPSFRLNQSFYKITPYNIPDIYYGWMQVCYSTYFRKSVCETVPVWIDFMVFFFCMFLCMVFRGKKIFLENFLFLGVFSLELSFGLMIESNMGQLFFLNSYASYFMSGLLLSLEPMTFMLFMVRQKSIWIREGVARFFIVISVVNVILVCIASFVPYIPFSWVKMYLGLVVLVLHSYMIVAAIHEILTMKEYPTNSEWGALISCPCIIIDLIVAIIKGDFVDLFPLSRIGFMFFLVGGVAQALLDFDAEEILVARTNQQKISSTIDIVTGCKTFMQMWRPDMNENIYMAVFCIKNLEENSGETVPVEFEKSVKNFSQILKDAFGEEVVYRGSGGKFAALIEDSTGTACREGVMRVMSEVAEFNELKLDYYMDVVYSYSRFSYTRDYDFNGMLSRMLSKLHQKFVSTRNA